MKGGAAPLATVFLISALGYLLLSWSGGFPDGREYVFAALVGLLCAGLVRRRKASFSSGALSPLRWIRFLYYLLVPFGAALLKSNIDVACRVFSGKIRPGIVKVTPDLAGDASLTFLANSITLTPGTLTVDVDEKSRSLYVHCLWLDDPDPSGESIYGPFERWARRIAG
jgi:multicomponent Na+:H+ antiporter subunit E